MGPATHCLLCEGRHPEGLHYTVRGILAVEPAAAPRNGGRDTFVAPAVHPAAEDSAAMSAPSRNAETGHGQRGG